MLHLDPPGICKLAKLSRTFRAAATGNFVWETKLPMNYPYLLEKASVGEENKVQLTKMEIYAKLCRRSPFDGGTKEFWLEKHKGRLCMSISSKALLITGIDDRRYWNYIPTEESRFRSVAYLQQIWWFEVGGEIEFCFPPGTYTLYFRLHLGRPSRRLGRPDMQYRARDTGIISQRRNQDSAQLPTFNRFGGLRWVVKLSSASRLALTLYIFAFTWAGHPGD
ncbi:hypothetical protein HPP92_007377 [Vanilla planifolia]|uniref:Uncharacterized protein n=1 Tax=Vanilla planifolia TaxID=51239 RepID=A0A835RG95_VANPL|nr:hypothetical protein HPP92_007377 [Vanilla planifolia]